jgi:hypothetical protein
VDEAHLLLLCCFVAAALSRKNKKTVLVVSIAQDGVASEKQRRFGSKRVQYTRHFDGDVASTDNAHALGLRSKAQAKHNSRLV